MSWPASTSWVRDFSISRVCTKGGCNEPVYRQGNAYRLTYRVAETGIVRVRLLSSQLLPIIRSILALDLADTVARSGRPIRHCLDKASDDRTRSLEFHCSQSDSKASMPRRMASSLSSDTILRQPPIAGKPASNPDSGLSSRLLSATIITGLEDGWGNTDVKRYF